MGEQAKSAAKGAARVAHVAHVQREADARLAAMIAAMALLKTAADTIAADAIAAQMQAVALRGRVPLSEDFEHDAGCGLRPAPFGLRRV